MNLQGIELISRHTKSASRVIWGLSGALLVVAHYDLNSEAWSFVNRGIQPNEFREIATVVVLFSVASLVVHWVSDYMAYTKWFQTNKLSADSIDAIGSFRKGTLGAKDALIGRIERLEASYKKYREDLENFVSTNQEVWDKSSKICVRVTSLEESVKKINRSQEEILRNNDELAALLEDIGPGLKKVSYASFFLIYIWYLALPVSVALTALSYMWLNAGAI